MKVQDPSPHFCCWFWTKTSSLCPCDLMTSSSDQKWQFFASVRIANEDMIVLSIQHLKCWIICLTLLISVEMMVFIKPLHYASMMTEWFHSMIFRSWDVQVHMRNKCLHWFFFACGQSDPCSSPSTCLLVSTNVTFALALNNLGRVTFVHFLMWNWNQLRLMLLVVR